MKRGDREERERGSLVVLENSIVLSEWLNDVERKDYYCLPSTRRPIRLLSRTVCVYNTHTLPTHTVI